MYGSGSPKPAAPPVCGLTNPILKGIASAADGWTLATLLPAAPAPLEAPALAVGLEVLTPQAARNALIPVATAPNAAAFKTVLRGMAGPPEAWTGATIQKTLAGLDRLGLDYPDSPAAKEPLSDVGCWTA